jgi:hypothetical protein
VVCPKLGFSEDLQRHFVRPTRLHRCNATPEPTLVSNREQVELCLRDQYALCPRFRSAVVSAPISQEPSESDADPPRARLAEQPPARVDIAQPPPGVSDAVADSPLSPLPRHRRQLALVSALAVGVSLIMVVLQVNPPSLTRDLAENPPAVPNDDSQAGETVAPARPDTALSPVPRPQAPTSGAAPRPELTAGPRSVTDVDFRSGPAADWVANPPYVAWSNGAYRLRARNPDQFVAVGVPSAQMLADVVVSATFRKTGGPPGGGYGLIVRDQGPQPRDGVNQQAHAYVLEAGDRGEFGVWRRDGDYWLDLVPWRRSESVHPGTSSNDLSVRAIGDQLQFSINAAQVAIIRDNTLPSGGIGVFVGGDYNEVALDHFRVEVPHED